MLTLRITAGNGQNTKGGPPELLKSADIIEDIEPFPKAENMVTMRTMTRKKPDIQRQRITNNGACSVARTVKPMQEIHRLRFEHEDRMRTLKLLSIRVV